MTIAIDEFLSKKNLLLSQNVKPDPCKDREGRQYTFEWVHECPSESILKLRNAENVLQYMADKNRITLEQHGKFIETYSKRPRIDFMLCYDLSRQLVAGVNINLTDIGLELGKYIGDSKFLGCGLGSAMTLSFLDFIGTHFSPIGKKMTVHARTMSTNKGNIDLNLKIGFKITRELSDGFVLMEKIL